MRPVPNLLTSAEVAQRAKVSTRTVARWVERGELEPAQKIPGIRGALLFDPAAVEAFLSEPEPSDAS